MSTDVQQLVEQIAAKTEATRDEPMPPDAVPTKPNKSVPVAVRLSADDAEALEDLAERLDLPVSALLRGWILAGLAAQRDESVRTAIDRLAADVQRLRELVA